MWLSQLLACLIGCLVVVNPAQVPYVRGGQLFFLQHKNMHAKGVCSHYGFPWCWAPSHDLMATVDANVLLALVL